MLRSSMLIVGALAAVVLGAGLLVPQVRVRAESHLLSWLLERRLNTQAALTAHLTAAQVTAVDPAELAEHQALIADWLSRKYRIAKEPLSALVAEAHLMGQHLGLAPELILSVMAMESRFNPFATSPVGAQGLMQVLASAHSDKYRPFGGPMAAFDPITNLRVGATILSETIRAAGSVEGGLRLYVGAVTVDGEGYIQKVLSEQDRLQRVAQGERVAFFAFERSPAALLDESKILESLESLNSRTLPSPAQGGGTPPGQVSYLAHSP